MSKYEFSLRQEVLLEKGADILGNLFRYGKKNNIPISNCADPINVMYSLIWKAKHDILVAETEEQLEQIESQFELAQRFSCAIGAQAV